MTISSAWPSSPVPLPRSPRRATWRQASTACDCSASSNVYYRESTLPCGLSIQVLHTASLQEPFAPRLARGPFIVGTGEGYQIKQLRFSDLDAAAGFFQLRVTQAP
ncbi:MAG: hypothetical protein H7A46_24805 [Verrucomicrobiales bacterium]|nr:hypothetical protein [Verrucomicrobiales bacterium]